MSRRILAGTGHEFLPDHAVTRLFRFFVYFGFTNPPWARQQRAGPSCAVPCRPGSQIGGALSTVPNGHSKPQQEIHTGMTFSRASPPVDRCAHTCSRPHVRSPTSPTICPSVSTLNPHLPSTIPTNAILCSGHRAQRDITDMARHVSVSGITGACGVLRRDAHLPGSAQPKCALPIPAGTLLACAPPAWRLDSTAYPLVLPRSSFSFNGTACEINRTVALFVAKAGELQPRLDSAPLALVSSILLTDGRSAWLAHSTITSLARC
jgi:hypothetical protein